MSLLGRLEDLSLPDIVQIVHLSRRTGVLEIIDGGGRKTVYFNHGLVVNAASPENPGLAGHLVATNRVSAEDLAGRAASGMPTGDYVLSRDLLTPDELAEAIQERIMSIVTPLVSSREGEFNFLLSERLDSTEIEYDSDSLFREGGLTPGKVLGSEGEKVKPLQGLEASMRAGKALLRGATAPPPTPLDIGLGAAAAPSAGGEAEPPSRPADPVPTASTPIEPEPDREAVEPEPFATEAPVEVTEPEPPPLPDHAEDTPIETGAPAEAESVQDQDEESRGKGSAAARFRVGSEPSIDEVAAMEEDRNVILYEREPLVRVAAKRAFSRKAARVFQFGTVQDTRAAVEDLLENNRFFVTFLDLSGETLDDDPAVKLLLRIKRKNRHLPVVVIDADADLKRRHAMLEFGADLYLTRPSDAHLQPGLAERSLAMFADELTLFAEKAFYDWEELTGTLGSGEGEVGRRFYGIAEKERLNRSVAMARQLINELSNPNDIREVGQTILRLAADYADRGALFVATHRHFIGLAGYGAPGRTEEIDDAVRTLRFRRDEPSVLQRVCESGEAHRGKIQRSQANVTLVESLGTIQPTEVVAIPIIHEDRALGVLYGDNAEQRAPIEDIGSLEFFLAQAAFAFENAIIANARRKGIDWD